MPIITEDLNSIDGVPLDAPVTFLLDAPRGASSGTGIILEDPRTFYPVAGVVTTDNLDPGPAKVRINGNLFDIEIPETASRLWPLILAGLVTPPASATWQSVVDAKIAELAGTYGRVKTINGVEPDGAGNVVIDGEGGSPTSLYKQLARNPEMLVSGAVTRNTDGIVTSAAVLWPDGTVGTFAVTSLGSFGVDSYYITYGSPVTATYAQPAITRDSNGVPTVVPDITLATLAPDTVAPTVPAGLAVTSIGATTAHAAWSAATDAGGVANYRLRNNGVVIATLNALEFDMSGLAAGASHSLTVSAIDAAGNESAQSSPVAFTTLALGFSDNFAGPEGSAIGRVSPGGAKTLQILKAGATVATPTITATGRLQFPDANGTVIGVYDANTPNGTFSVSYAFIDTDRAPIIALKAEDYNNRIVLARVSSSVRNWMVSKTVAGTSTTIFESAVAIGSTALVVAVWSGTTLTVNVDGALLWTGTVTEFAASTKFGAGVLSASNESLLDDFNFAAA